MTRVEVKTILGELYFPGEKYACLGNFVCLSGANYARQGRIMSAWGELWLSEENYACLGRIMPVWGG